MLQINVDVKDSETLLSETAKQKVALQWESCGMRGVYNPSDALRAPPPFTQGRLFVLQINVDVKDSETFIS